MDGHVADPSRAQDRYPTVQSDASGFPTPLGHAWRRSGGHPGAARRVESLETPNHRNICDLIGGHVADPSRASFATQRCEAGASGFPTSLGHAWRRSGGHPGAARRVEGLENPNHRYICDLTHRHIADPSRAHGRYLMVQTDASGLPTSLGHAWLA